MRVELRVSRFVLLVVSELVHFSEADALQRVPDPASGLPKPLHALSIDSYETSESLVPPCVMAFDPHIRARERGQLRDSLHRADLSRPRSPAHGGGIRRL